jgi:hypothetical protein
LGRYREWCIADGGRTVWCMAYMAVASVHKYSQSPDSLDRKES